MKILLQGQLQTAAGVAEVALTPVADETVAEIIARCAKDLPPEAQKLLLDAEGAVRSSLFVAVDGEHSRDLTQSADRQELLLMPPMAGG